MTRHEVIESAQLADTLQTMHRKMKRSFDAAEPPSYELRIDRLNWPNLTAPIAPPWGNRF